MIVGKLKRRTRQEWQLFKESEPGRRFQDRYRRRRSDRGDRVDTGTLVNIGIGIALVAAGALMVVFPGPGWLTFVLGVGFFAGEFRPIAHFMDRSELRLTELGRWAWRFWANSSFTARVFIVAAVLLITAALAFGAYHLLFGDVRVRFARFTQLPR